MLHQSSSDSRMDRHPLQPTMTQVVTVGLVGGLVGTIVMDLFGISLVILLGGAPTISFSIIGDAAAGFMAMLGIDIAGGTPLGATLHYLIGLLLGAIFAVLVLRIQAFHLNSTLKAVGLGVIFVELMSLPMLIAAAVILKMSDVQMGQWFGMSFVMHLVYGGVLGLVVRYGLRSGTVNRHGLFHFGA